jgi:tetratricopeptide (TPR) repeat protein
MPTNNAKAPKDTLNEAKAHMDKAEWKKAVEVLNSVFTEQAKDPVAKQAVAMAHFLRAQCLVHMGDLEKATDDCNHALVLAKASVDILVEGEALRLLGNIGWKKADYKTALEHLNRAHEIACQLKDDRLEGMVHLELGAVYMQTKDHLVSEREFREAVLALEKAGDLRELARAYNNFANNFTFQKKWEKAAEMFGKCKKIAEKVGDEGFIAWGAFNRAECLLELGDPKAAMKELELAIPILERTDDRIGLLGAYQVAGLTYAKMGNWKEAEEFLIKARRLAQRQKMPVAEGSILRDIGRIFKWRGDKDKAILYFKEAQDLFEKHGAKSELERLNDEMKDLA